MRSRFRLRRLAPLVAGAALLLIPVTALATSPSSTVFTTALGGTKIVPVPENPVRWYANDSTFPYLRSSKGTTNITFWVDGADYRSTGKSLDTMHPIRPATAVLSAGAAGTFDGNGVWLSSAQRDPRKPSGVIYGFYHAEDHRFRDGGYGEWNSTGLATSTDDGVTWTKRGKIIGTPKPAAHAFGGIEANSVVYDPVARRWLGIGHGVGYVSTDPKAAPGTWKGWYNGAFRTRMPSASSSPRLQVLPGLSSTMAGNNITWNTYLHRFVMVWQAWGKDTKVLITTSGDGVHWSPSRTLFSVGSAHSVGKAQIIGVSSSESGKNAILVYEQSPSTTGRYRDMIERPIHFHLKG
ncbi:hypothetical protein ACWC4D_23300 [Streptomyces sp. NPDC001288]|uniref:hypothetical protein n=1 Tax=unclassified Streptomyces TaxID=2593676 RepID=UPI00332DCE91